MSIKFDTFQIHELMKSFYTMSGIKFVLYDANFNKLISYPEFDCDFCRIMKSAAPTRRKCRYADMRSFEKCKQTQSLVLYNCHAGLVEAIMPLKDNESIIGYLMFGQIASISEKEGLLEKAEAVCEKYSLDKESVFSALKQIPFKSDEQITAAAKIMEACTGFIVYRELITPENSRTFERAKEYIEAHLSDNFSVSQLCRELSVGRTRLYEIFKAECNMGINEYITRRRMHRAKKLLKTTDLTLLDIAQNVGYDDYNYFGKVYKKIYGKSPKKYR